MPAAAVIPAPIAYIKVVAVKKLVVGFWVEAAWSAAVSCVSGRACLPSGELLLLLTEWEVRIWIVYFEKIRVFKAGILL